MGVMNGISIRIRPSLGGEIYSMILIQWEIELRSGSSRARNWERSRSNLCEL